MIKIRVLRSDIIKGEQGHCSLCPVARAVKRATHRPVIVWDDVVTITRGHRPKQYITPYKVERFIYKFDGGKKVKPFSFTLS